MSRTESPTDYIYVPLRAKLYAELISHTGQADVSYLIEGLLEQYLVDMYGEDDTIILKFAEEKDEEFRSRYGDPGRGYQWSTVFLPNGTQVRMTYRNRDYYAEICHGRLWYDGDALSPSQFARLVANNTNRNAWRDLYIQFPGEGVWKTADNLRRVKPLSLSDF